MKKSQVTQKKMTYIDPLPPVERSPVAVSHKNKGQSFVHQGYAEVHFAINVVHYMENGGG